MKKMLKRAIASVLALSMMLASSVTMYAEEANVETKEARCIEISLDETTKVVDPVLLEQLNRTSKNNNSRSMPTPSWPNNREYDITDGERYTERIKLSTGDYYSPAFLVNITSNIFSRFYIEAITLDYNGLEPYYLNTTIYIYNSIERDWHSEDVMLDFSEVFYFKFLFDGTEEPYVEKVCLNFKKSGSEGSNIAYSVWQT